MGKITLEKTLADRLNLIQYQNNWKGALIKAFIWGTAEQLHFPPLFLFLTDLAST